MDVIDFHAHIFPDDLAPRAIAALISNSPESKNHTDGTASDLKKSMAENRIKRSIILPVATKASQVAVINRSCKELSSPELIPFGALHPLFTEFEEEIKFLKDSEIPGIKFHPEYQDFYIDSSSMFPIYEQLSCSGLIVVFHAGKDPGPFTCDHALPPALKKVCANFPHLLIVAAHMGGWKLWDEVETELTGLPLYFDTAAVTEGLSKEQFARIVRKHGSEQILFGTDSPWFDQGKSRKWIEESGLTDKEIERIFILNAIDLLAKASFST